MTNRTKDGWLPRAVATGSVSGMIAFVWTHAVLPWVVPIATPLAVGLVARTEGLPWTQTVVASLISFASIAHGLLRFDEWRDRRRVADKLALLDPMIGVRRTAPDTGPATALRLGFNLVSKATFPIEFRVAQVRTLAGNLQNPNPTYSTRALTTPVLGTAFFWDDEIAIEHPILDRQVDCRVEASLVYGRAGNLKHKMTKNWILHAKFDDKGLPAGAAQWSEVN